MNCSDINDTKKKLCDRLKVTRPQIKSHLTKVQDLKKINAHSLITTLV